MTLYNAAIKLLIKFAPVNFWYSSKIYAFGKVVFSFQPNNFLFDCFFAAYWFILYWQVKQYKCGMLNIFFKCFNGI